MIELSAVYQHSKEGRNEIVKKCHGLTRSERLVLIVIDGITPVDKIRDRLGAAADEAFQRAMDKLQSLGLIHEVICAPANFTYKSAPDAVDTPFPRLDALAPVTVVCSDPHYDFSAAAVAATSDFSSLCPTATTALALEEWSALRGWHLKWHAQPVKSAVIARRGTHVERKASAFWLPWSTLETPAVPNFSRARDLAERGQFASEQAGGKRPFAIRIAIAIAAVITGTMAVVR